MATRTFCDHCGNTVRNPKRFSFGPQHPGIDYERDLAYAIKAQGGMAGVGLFPQGVSPLAQQAPPAGTLPTKVIDLCDTCVPIWYERVDMLCRGSDPKDE